MGNHHGKSTSGGGAAATTSSSSGESKTSGVAHAAAVLPPTAEDAGLPLLIKEGPYFERLSKRLDDYNKGSDIAPHLNTYGDTYRNQFDFSFANPANGSYEVLRVQRYLASGGYAHVFMAKQVLADGGLGASVAIKFMYKRGDTELVRLEQREVSCAVNSFLFPPSPLLWRLSFLFFLSFCDPDFFYFCVFFIFIVFVFFVFVFVFVLLLNRCKDLLGSQVHSMQTPSPLSGGPHRRNFQHQ